MKKEPKHPSVLKLKQDPKMMEALTKLYEKMQKEKTSKSR
jgi:hypothetical protein